VGIREGIEKFMCGSEPEIEDGSDEVKRTNTRSERRTEVGFFAYKEIREIIYTTNAIESLHMQLRKVLKNRGHFPSDEAATKLIYLVLHNIIKKWETAYYLETGSQPICDQIWRKIFCGRRRLKHEKVGELL
jgi:mutator family transposase